jgi:hypothetical protein
VSPKDNDPLKVSIGVAQAEDDTAIAATIPLKKHFLNDDMETPKVVTKTD